METVDVVEPVKVTTYKTVLEDIVEPYEVKVAKVVPVTRVVRKPVTVSKVVPYIYTVERPRIEYRRVQITPDTLSALPSDDPANDVPVSPPPMRIETN
jgi:hypothetical protein